MQTASDQKLDSGKGLEIQLDTDHPITPIYIYMVTSCPCAGTFSQLLQTFWSRPPLLHSALPLTVRRCECGREGVRDTRGASESVSVKGGRRKGVSEGMSEGVREWPGNDHITKLLFLHPAS